MPFPSPVHECESEVAQSCPTPRDPMDCSPPGPSVHGIFQARVLKWVANDLIFSLRCRKERESARVRVCACVCVLGLLEGVAGEGYFSYKTAASTCCLKN